jgi:ribose/xylose/arabinose/galactoside ABC-type transport system permease subunit
VASEQLEATERRPITLRQRVSTLGLRELTLIPAIALAIVVGSFASDAFLTPDNFLNILQQSSELSVVVIAETLVLISGKFDLSLESIVGLAPMLGAWLIIKDTEIGGSGVGLAWWLAIPVVLAAGALIGAINGLMIVKLRLNAFIVTLAMLILLRGVQLGTTNGKTLFNLPDGYLYLGSGKWAGIPVSIWIAGILYLVFGLFLRYHRLGRALYAIGGNAEAARVAGIRVERVLWGTLIMGGFLAALAGLMLTGRIASVVTTQGQNMIFYVFAAAVIGGISLNGGKGRLLGALTGVLLLGILQNVLTLAEIPAFWIDAVYGAIILVALILSRVTGAGAEDA